MSALPSICGRPLIHDCAVCSCARPGGAPPQPEPAGRCCRAHLSRRPRAGTWRRVACLVPALSSSRCRSLGTSSTPAHRCRPAGVPTRCVGQAAAAGRRRRPGRAQHARAPGIPGGEGAPRQPAARAASREQQGGRFQCRYPHLNHGLCCQLQHAQVHAGRRVDAASAATRTLTMASVASSIMRRCMLVGGLKLPQLTSTTGRYVSLE